MSKIITGIGVGLKMCEANAYLRKGDKEELVLEMVDKVVPYEDGLLLEDIYGRRKIIKAKIKELALVDHKIILERE
ncbi:CooT family nickel-binding protein [Thermodesulfitimonas sp.]